MTANPEHVLAPFIRKLQLEPERHASEISGIENLPCLVRKFSRGNYIVREGDRPGDCFIVLGGFVYRNKLTDSGARQILAIHLRGDLACAHDRLLGEADHNIQALTEVRVACVPQDRVLALAEEFPAISRALWRDNLLEASIAREWMLNVGQRNARGRLSHLVCELTLRLEDAELGSGPHYPWPLTQEELGDALALTAVHVNRTAQRLRSDGIMSLGKQKVTIKDRAALQSAGDFRDGYLHRLEGA